MLRVRASLDLETVLQEIIDTARALTGARFGVIATVDAAGQLLDFGTAGLVPGYHVELAAWADGPRLFAHFRNLPEPLRVANLPAYVRGLGFPTSTGRRDGSSRVCARLEGCWRSCWTWPPSAVAEAGSSWTASP